MSNISGGRRRYERIEWSVPLHANHATGSSGNSWGGARDISDLQRKIEQSAKEHGIDTSYDDWFHVDAYEDDRLVFWFELPDRTKWVNDEELGKPALPTLVFPPGVTEVEWLGHTVRLHTSDPTAD